MDSLELNTEKFKRIFAGYFDSVIAECGADERFVAVSKNEKKRRVFFLKKKHRFPPLRLWRKWSEIALFLRLKSRRAVRSGLDIPAIQ